MDCVALELLRACGEQDYIGEPVTQLAHALQCAALAARAGASEAVVAAALLHDIGHLCSGPQVEHVPGLGAIRHEHVGADYLARAGYPALVCELVRGHVQAKRFQVAARPRYAESLSPASQRTLRLQGGPMSPREVAAFRADPLQREKLRLRAWDERAKDPSARVCALDDYAALLARVRATAAEPHRRTR